MALVKKKKFIMKAGFIILLSIFLFSSCKNSITNPIVKNNPPETVIWVDSIAQVLSSQFKIHWWGDDPDGFVKGYKISVDGINWNFTTSNESTFTFTLGEQIFDTTSIQVSAVDNLDLIDPTPAKINSVVKNTPPEINFDNFTEIPSITLPVATFNFKATDKDGNNTIKNIFISLNDTLESSWVKISPFANLVTLVGDLSDTSKNIVNAKIKLGSNLTETETVIQNLKLNSNNIFYIKCEDISGAKSKISQLPKSGKNWYVKKPNGSKRILLIDDYPVSNPNPDDVFKTSFSNANGNFGMTFSDVDLYDIITQPISPSIAQPFLIETMKFYKSVFWYGKVANLDLAQKTIPQYIDNGGKVLFATGFANLQLSGIDPSTLAIDFAPIDSLITFYKNDSLTNTGYISRVYKDSKIISIDSSRFPNLNFSNTAIFGTYAIMPGAIDSVIYKLDFPKQSNSEEKWFGQPAVGIKSNNGKIIFFTIPLHLLQSVDQSSGKTQIVLLIEKIFREEFGL